MPAGSPQRERACWVASSCAFTSYLRAGRGVAVIQESRRRRGRLSPSISGAAGRGKPSGRRRRGPASWGPWQGGEGGGWLALSASPRRWKDLVQNCKKNYIFKLDFPGERPHEEEDQQRSQQQPRLKSRVILDLLLFILVSVYLIFVILGALRLYLFLNRLNNDNPKEA